MGNQRPRIFTTLDFFSGYHQILLDEDSRDDNICSSVWLLQMVSHAYIYMGLSNAPAAFGKAMNRIFGDMLFKNMWFYADD